MEVVCYTDVKSPYAFLAFAETCRLEDAWGKPIEELIYSDYIKDQNNIKGTIKINSKFSLYQTKWYK